MARLATHPPPAPSPPGCVNVNVPNRIFGDARANRVGEGRRGGRRDLLRDLDPFQPRHGQRRAHFQVSNRFGTRMSRRQLTVRIQFRGPVRDGGRDFGLADNDRGGAGESATSPPAADGRRVGRRRRRRDAGRGRIQRRSVGARVHRWLVTDGNSSSGDRSRQIGARLRPSSARPPPPPSRARRTPPPPPVLRMKLRPQGRSRSRKAPERRKLGRLSTVSRRKRSALRGRGQRKPESAADGSELRASGERREAGPGLCGRPWFPGTGPRGETPTDEVAPDWCQHHRVMLVVDGDDVTTLSLFPRLPMACFVLGFFPPFFSSPKQRHPASSVGWRKATPAGQRHGTDAHWSPGMT